jgi:hypothetical protein
MAKKNTNPPVDIPVELKKDCRIICDNSKEGLKTINHYLALVFEFVSHEKKVDAVLSYRDTLSVPLNYPDPPKPKQRTRKK